MTRRADSGVVAVDFAVSAGAVLLLAAALFDVANLVAARHSLNIGVARAARYAAIHSGTSTSSILAAFNAAVAPTLGATASAAHCTVSFQGGNAVGGSVVVSATYAWVPASVVDSLAHVTLAATQTLTILH